MRNVIANSGMADLSVPSFGVYRDIGEFFMSVRVIKCNNKLLLVAKRNIQGMSAQNVCVQVEFFFFNLLRCSVFRVEECFKVTCICYSFAF